MSRSFACPLSSYSFSDTEVSLTTEFRPVRSGAHLVDAGFSSLNDMTGVKVRESLEPQASRLGLTVSVFPWLDNLIWFPDCRTDLPNGVLDGDLRNMILLHQQIDKLKRVGLFLLPAGPPPSATDCQISTGREREEHIPVKIKDVPDVALIVWPGGVTR